MSNTSNLLICKGPINAEQYLQILDQRVSHGRKGCDNSMALFLESLATKFECLHNQNLSKRGENMALWKENATLDLFEMCSWHHIQNVHM